MSRAESGSSPHPPQEGREEGVVQEVTTILKRFLGGEKVQKDEFFEQYTVLGEPDGFVDILRDTGSLREDLDMGTMQLVSGNPEKEADPVVIHSSTYNTFSNSSIGVFTGIT